MAPAPAASSSSRQRRAASPAPSRCGRPRRRRRSAAPRGARARPAAARSRRPRRPSRASHRSGGRRAPRLRGQRRAGGRRPAARRGGPRAWRRGRGAAGARRPRRRPHHSRRGLVRRPSSLRRLPPPRRWRRPCARAPPRVLMLSGRSRTRARAPSQFRPRSTPSPRWRLARLLRRVRPQRTGRAAPGTACAPTRCPPRAVLGPTGRFRRRGSWRRSCRSSSWRSCAIYECCGAVIALGGLCSALVCLSSRGGALTVPEGSDCVRASIKSIQKALEASKVCGSGVGRTFGVAF